MSKYLDDTGLSYLISKIKTLLGNKMDKTNPTGTGSFSLNRKEGTTIGVKSFAHGSRTEASGDGSHAEGGETVASGMYAHAEGASTQATNQVCHSEGFNTVASGVASHAEGDETVASGGRSHAEGKQTAVSALCGHAEGILTNVTAEGAHAEGRRTTASGVGSHSEGTATQALGAASHAEGYGTIADGEGQHVSGTFNVQDTSHLYMEIVGGGTNEDNCKNIRTLDRSGNAEYAGDVTAGGCGGENPVSLLEFYDLYLGTMVPMTDDDDDGVCEDERPGPIIDDPDDPIIPIGF